MKKIIFAFLSLILSTMHISACAAENYDWAEKEIKYCQRYNIMTGDEHGNLNPGGTLTRAEMAKMLVESFDLGKTSENNFLGYNNPNRFEEYDPQYNFLDVTPDLWFYDYAAAIKGYMTQPDRFFKGNEAVSREEFACTLVLASGLNAGYLCNYQILDDNFTDAKNVSPKYKKLLSVAVERAYYRGSDYALRPKDTLKRAEVCALLYRVLEAKKGNITLTWEDLGVPYSATPLMGPPEVTMESAIRWARSHNASDLFIDAAQYYWKYGELTGIRPDVLYAQSAKETAYGRYGGRVLPEMNNFAGIKKYGAVNDATEDHETFETREDGVRGHFNHMSAYVGITPIGDVHGRYFSVKSIAWAGTVKYVEALGGKWCPDLYYGYAIVNDLLPEMKKY